MISQYLVWIDEVAYFKTCVYLKIHDYTENCSSTSSGQGWAECKFDVNNVE